jgi:hypothetical protein
MAFNNTRDGLNTAITRTNNLYAGNSFQGIPTVGVVAEVTNSEYTFAQYGVDTDLANFRVVGCGLRARYIGNELNRGGQMVALHEPNHQTLFGKSLTGLTGYEQGRRFPIDRDWVLVTWIPLEQSEQDLKGTFVTAIQGNPMGIIWQANAGVSLDVEWECYAVLEISGRNIRGLTMSHVDAAGFAAVSSNAYAPGSIPGSVVQVASHVVGKFLGIDPLVSLQQKNVSDAKATGAATQSGFSRFMNGVGDFLGHVAGGVIGMV